MRCWWAEWQVLRRWRRRCISRAISTGTARGPTAAASTRAWRKAKRGVSGGEGMAGGTGNGLHVASIMDGNGRWAARRGLPRVAGHRAGLTAARRTVEHADALGVRRLTL